MTVRKGGFAIRLRQSFATFIEGRNLMNSSQRVNMLRTAAALAALVLMGSLGSISGAHAEDGDRNDEHGEGGADAARIRRGFEIAPVPLNLQGKNRALVGLGSYIVNAVGECDGCHSAGPPTQFANGGNPYFKGNPPKVVNPATYLGGGRDFGSLVPGTPNIISRNLTPDKTGRPEGGRTFAEFRQIIRTGVDLDGVHPNCSATRTTDCFPAMQPFNGDLLLVMPWFAYQEMTDHDLRAIYEYLSAIPCIAGPATGVLHNDCF